MEKFPYLDSPIEGKSNEGIEKRISEPVAEEKSNDEKKSENKKKSKPLQKSDKKLLKENPKMFNDHKNQKTMKREDLIKFSNETESDEDHYFLIIPCSEFRKDVREKKLKNRIQFIHENVELHYLCIAVIGTEKLTDEEEYAVMDVEFSFKCFWRFLKKTEDLVSWLMMATKSVAEIPYKLEQEKKYELQKQFFDLANRDTVRVDKNGNGLDRLWRQMLTVFPLVNLETAEAIAAVYSSPTGLYKAYDSSTNPEEMLQDIPIRRAHGPLTSVRKVGPELSKKIYKFFTADENVLL